MSTEEARTMRKLTFGRHSHWKVLSNCARLAAQNRHLHQAEHLYESALTEALLIGDGAEAARTFWRLGRLAAYQKEFLNAERFWLKALQSSTNLDKTGSYFTFRTYIHLSWNCLQQQRVSEAKVWVERAMACHEQGIATHTHTIKLLLKLCWALKLNQHATTAHRSLLSCNEAQRVEFQLQVV